MTAPLTPEQVADVLDDAADYIEAHGWVQNTLALQSGRVCAIGAINSVLQEDGGLLPDRSFQVSAKLAGSIGGGGLAAWNDDPGRTKQEVLDAFRLAAKQQRGRSPA